MYSPLFSQIQTVFEPVQVSYTMNVRNEPDHDMAYVVKREPPPEVETFNIEKNIQPIADRVAQNLEIISKNVHFNTRRTLLFIIYYLVLNLNPMGRILVRSKSFRNNLEILCNPICNRLLSVSGINLIVWWHL